MGAVFEAIHAGDQMQKVAFAAGIGLDELAHDAAQRHDFVLDGVTCRFVQNRTLSVAARNRYVADAHKRPVCASDGCFRLS
jgi:hypothetical protein